MDHCRSITFSGRTKLLSVIFSYLTLTLNSAKIFFYLRPGDNAILDPPVSVLAPAILLVALQQAPKLVSWVVIAVCMKYYFLMFFALLILSQGSMLWKFGEFTLLGFCSSWITATRKTVPNIWNKLEMKSGKRLKLKRGRWMEPFLAAFLSNAFVVISVVFFYLLGHIMTFEAAPHTPLIFCLDDLGEDFSTAHCAANIEGRWIPSSSCLFHFNSNFSDVPFFRICANNERPKDLWHSILYSLVVMFAMSMVITIIMELLKNEVTVYQVTKFLSHPFITSSMINDLMSEKFLSKFLSPSSRKRSRRRQTQIDSLLKEVASKARSEILTKPGISTGQSCLDLAENKGYLQFLNLQYAHSNNEEFQYNIIGKTGQLIVSNLIVPTVRSDIYHIDPAAPSGTYTVSIVRAFRKITNLDQEYLEKYSMKREDQEILTCNDNLEISKAVGLMKELTIFFSYFNPESKEDAEYWYAKFKEEILNSQHEPLPLDGM